jgi:epoxide hydrolase-like predicted phosphatase
MTPITTIIFDLSEVYLTGLKETEIYLSKLWGISEEEFYKKMHGKELNDYFHGKTTEDELIEAVLKNNSWPIGKQEFKELIRQNFKEVEGTREIIEKLKEKGFRLGLLSIHGKEWVEHLEKKFDYHKLFDSILYSFDIEVSKPDKQAYIHILERLKVKPEECLFIDDCSKNVRAAEELGIKGVHFKNSSQLKSELEKMGIAFS